MSDSLKLVSDIQVGILMASHHMKEAGLSASGLEDLVDLISELRDLAYQEGVDFASDVILNSR